MTAASPPDIDGLTPVQRMILEVYRTHTRRGYPGSTPGEPKHDGACRKCGLLRADREEFEQILRWRDVEHLMWPPAGTGRVRSANASAE